MIMEVRLPPNMKQNVGHLQLTGDTSGHQRIPRCLQNVHKKSHYPSRSQIVSELRRSFCPQGLLLMFQAESLHESGGGQEMVTGLSLLLSRSQLHSLAEET